MTDAGAGREAAPPANSPAGPIHLTPASAHEFSEVADWDHVDNHIAFAAGADGPARLLTQAGVDVVACFASGARCGAVVFERIADASQGAARWAFVGARPLSCFDGLEAAVIAHAFGVLRLRRLECRVDGAQRGQIRQRLRHGFSAEGVEREALLVGGRAIDLHRFAMLAADYEKRIADAIGDASARRANLAGTCIVFEREIGAALVDAYSAATGDDNPVHLSDAAARAQGFAGRIAHGMLLGGAFSRHFANDFPGPGTIYVSQSLEFHAPVTIGAAAAIEFTVLSHIGRRLSVQTRVLVDGKVCVDGVAVLMLPKDFVLPGA